MKNIAVFVLLILSSAIPSWAQFYKDYPEGLRKELAEAYYLAGEKYLALGFSQGENYKKLAYEIYPGFNPKSIDDAGYRKTHAASLDRTGSKHGRSPEQAKAARTISYRFVRFMGALASKSFDTMPLFLDGAAGTKDEMLSKLEHIMTDTPVPCFAPNDLYDFSSVTIKPSPSGKRYELRIRIKNSELKSTLGFLADEQVFGYRRAENTYLIDSIEGIYEIGNARAESADTELKIKQVFEACLESFFGKDVESVSRHIGGEIVILPMNTRITNAEVAMTFTGYFKDENLQTGGLSASGIFEAEKTRVGKTQVLSDKFPGGVYKLIPSLKREYIRKIPFFAQYKEFYFAFIENEWRIVAVS